MKPSDPCPSAAMRRGVTLIELLVVLVILGVTTGIAGLAFRTGRGAPRASLAMAAQIARMRHAAISGGHDTSITLVVDDRPQAVTVFPDGRVLIDSLPALDPMSGQLVSGEHDAAH